MKTGEIWVMKEKVQRTFKTTLKKYTNETNENAERLINDAKEVIIVSFNENNVDLKSKIGLVWTDSIKLFLQNYSKKW